MFYYNTMINFTMLQVNINSTICFLWNNLRGQFLQNTCYFRAESFLNAKHHVCLFHHMIISMNIL